MIVVEFLLSYIAKTTSYPSPRLFATSPGFAITFSFVLRLLLAKPPPSGQTDFFGISEVQIFRKFSSRN